MSSKRQSAPKESSPTYFVGQLLVAMPQMQDPRFRESVIFLCGHDEKGAMGIMLNKLVESVSTKELFEQLGLHKSDKNKTPSLHVHYGGPVEIGRGFVLHSSDYVGENSVEITEDISLSASTNILQDLVQGQGPDHILLALGYAGWSSGQLEDEIMQNGWLLLPADASTIFDDKPTTLWRRTLQKNGVDPEHLSAHLGHA